MAYRDRSKDLDSMQHANANKHVGIAASGQCPIKSSAVTAIVIKALIFRFALRMATQPVFNTGNPTVASTVRVKITTPQCVSAAIHSKTSAPVAAKPATISGQMACLGVGSTVAELCVCCCGLNPILLSAVTIVSNA